MVAAVDEDELALLLEADNEVATPPATPGAGVGPRDEEASMVEGPPAPAPGPQVGRGRPPAPAPKADVVTDQGLLLLLLLLPPCCGCWLALPPRRFNGPAAAAGEAAWAMGERPRPKSSGAPAGAGRAVSTEAAPTPPMGLPTAPAPPMPTAPPPIDPMAPLDPPVRVGWKLASGAAGTDMADEAEDQHVGICVLPGASILSGRTLVL